METLKARFENNTLPQFRISPNIFLLLRASKLLILIRPTQLPSHPGNLDCKYCPEQAFNYP